jgi:hypothetical protein
MPNSQSKIPEASESNVGKARTPPPSLWKPRRLIFSNRGEVSLFPFMSILACLIGILALLIGLSMAVNQKKQGMTQEEVDRAKEHKSLEFLVKKKQKELEDQKKSLEATSLSTMEMEKLKQMLLELEKEKTDLEAIKLTPEDELRAKIQLYRDEKLAIEKEQPTLQKKIDELKAKLAQLKEIPQPKESVKIRPPKAGAKVPRNLYFVECNSSGIVLRGADDETAQISLASIKSGSVEFAEFCQKAKQNSGDDYVILFLVRKGGREVYEYANAAAELDFKVKTAKLPVPNEGQIDLSKFFLKKL